MSRMTQFLCFALVGVAGFVVDWLCLTFFLWTGIGFFVGRGFSYFCAATVTWALNRRLTFQSTDVALVRQWGKFLSANAAGGITNYLISVTLMITLPHLIDHYPILAVAAGSLSGLVMNFCLSKRFVFRPLRDG